MTTEQLPEGADQTHSGPFPDADAHAHAHYGSGPAQLRRARGGRLVGGVAAGVAAWLDLDVTVVRIGLVVLTLMGGVGIPLYVAAWLLVPEEGTEECVLADLLSAAQPAHPA